MNTIQLYQTHDRIIFDIRWWSFYLYKTRRLWMFKLYSWKHVCIGPIEIVKHGKGD